MRLSMPWLQFQGAGQAIVNPTGHAKLQCLDNGNALPVPAQIESPEIVAVGIVGEQRNGPLGPGDRALETRLL